MAIIALIPAAGVGSRFGGPLPKQYVQIEGLPVILHTLRALSITDIDAIYVISQPEDLYFDRLVVSFPQFFSVLKHQFSSTTHVLGHLKQGGKTRMQSVAQGLNYLFNTEKVTSQDWILVHDAVRCCLPREHLLALLTTAQRRQKGAILAQKVMDTVKQVDEEGNIVKTVDRRGLWLAQTPQIFKAKELKVAFAHTSDYQSLTDESSLFERQAIKPIVVTSDHRNFKITTAADLHYAQYLLSQQKETR